MSDFLKSSARIDQAIIDATTGKDASFEGMRERLLQELAGAKVVVRDDAYGVRVLPGQHTDQTPEVSLSANPARDMCSRVIYPAGNNRFEIYGVSESELDEKERQIRAMFPSA